MASISRSTLVVGLAVFGGILAAGAAAAGWQSSSTFAREVLPEMGGGSAQSQNLALPAAAYRLFNSPINTDLFQTDLGAYRWLAYLAAVLAIVTVLKMDGTHLIPACSRHSQSLPS